MYLKACFIGSLIILVKKFLPAFLPFHCSFPSPVIQLPWVELDLCVWWKMSASPSRRLQGRKLMQTVYVVCVVFFLYNVCKAILAVRRLSMSNNAGGHVFCLPFLVFHSSHSTCACSGLKNRSRILKHWILTWRSSTLPSSLWQSVGKVRCYCCHLVCYREVVKCNSLL